MQSIPQFFQAPSEYIIHNATDEEISVMWHGETRKIPPFSETVYPSTEHPYACYSGTDSEGSYIPGSLLFRDIYDVTDDGEGFTMVWDAKEAIKNVLGIDAKSMSATSPYAKRGLSFIPSKSSPADVKAIVRGGRERYEVWRIVEARDLVKAHDENNLTRTRMGGVPLPGGPAYDKAVAFLAASYEREKKRAADVLAKSDSIIRDVPEQAISLGDEPTDDDGFTKAEENELFMRAQAAAVTLAKKAVVAETGDENPSSADLRATADKMMQDPAFMALVKEKYKVRKIPKKRETVGV